MTEILAKSMRVNQRLQPTMTTSASTTTVNEYSQQRASDMKEKDTDELVIKETGVDSTLTVVDEEMTDELTETGNVNALKLDNVIASITKDQKEAR